MGDNIPELPIFLESAYKGKEQNMIFPRSFAGGFRDECSHVDPILQ